jgi:hypothetical protein
VIVSLFQYVTIAFILELEYKFNLVVAWCVSAVVINSYFLVDLTLHVVAWGPWKLFTERKIFIIELALQCVCITSDVYFLDGKYSTTIRAINLCCCVILLRLTRLLYIFAEL